MVNVVAMECFSCKYKYMVGSNPSSELPDCATEKLNSYDRRHHLEKGIVKDCGAVTLGNYKCVVETDVIYGEGEESLLVT